MPATSCSSGSGGSLRAEVYVISTNGWRTPVPADSVHSSASRTGSRRTTLPSSIVLSCLVHRSCEGHRGRSEVAEATGLWPSQVLHRNFGRVQKYPPYARNET